MDMETARLASASWLPTTDWQAPAMRAAGLPLDGLHSGSGNPPRQLPPLDWPADLFDDERPWR